MGGIRNRAMRQGELDSLCGIYAVINAVRKAARNYQSLDLDDCVWFFTELIKTLDANDSLRRAVIDGLSSRDLSQLLGATNELLQRRFKASLTYHRPFWGRPNIGLKGLRQLICAQEQETATAMLVAFSDHWSVIDSMTRSGLRLVDSSNDRPLRFDKLVVTSRSYIPNKDCLQPSSVWLLRYQAFTKSAAKRKEMRARGR